MKDWKNDRMKELKIKELKNERIIELKKDDSIIWSMK